MVVDMAFVAGTVASFLMNGACCLYQVNREDDLKEELREELRREWYEQRKREMMNQREMAEEQRASFEERYKTLVNRSDDQSYTQRRSMTWSAGTPSPSSLQRQQHQQLHDNDSDSDPPTSVDAHIMHSLSRSSSLLDEVEEGTDEDVDTEENTCDGLMLTADGTLDDVSIA